MDKPIKVSIIVPIYNRESLLSKCLGSLANQSLQDIEILLINDGSTDDSETICLQYTHKYPDKFKYHYCVNGGVSRARNLGISLAIGEYVGFVDSDDWINPGFYQSLYSMALQNNADIVGCNINVVNNNDVVIKILVDKIVTMDEYINNPVDRVGAVWNKIFKKDLIDHYNLRFIADCHYSEDLAFTYCAVMVANKCVNINSYLYNYYPNEQSITQNRQIRRTLLKELYSVVDCTYLFLVQNNLMNKASVSFHAIFINEILCAWCPRAMRNMMLDSTDSAQQIYLEYKRMWNLYVKKNLLVHYLILTVNYLKFEIFKTFPSLIKFLKSTITVSPDSIRDPLYNKKKLLFVWPNLDFGGGEVALINLFEQLAASYEINILCYEHVNKFNLPDKINVVFATQSASNKIFKFLNKIRFFYKWLSSVKSCDLQIINEVPFMVIMAVLVTAFTRKKYVIWAHSCRGEMGSGYNKSISRIYKYALAKARCIVCVSNYAANSMRDYIKPLSPDILVIYNLFKFNLPTDPVFQLPADIIKICAVGRLTHEKNFSLLIDAIALVVPKITDTIHVYICGDGNEIALLTQKISDLHLESCVTLVGHLTNALGYINQCDIFVSPSNSEALPTVVCEALYCNKSIIATNTGAAEVLEYGKYGIIIDKGDVNQLADALLRLITDKNLRDQYAHKGGGALDKFNQPQIVSQWLQLIEGGL